MKKLPGKDRLFDASISDEEMQVFFLRHSCFCKNKTKAVCPWQVVCTLVWHLSIVLMELTTKLGTVKSPARVGSGLAHKNTASMKKLPGKDRLFDASVSDEEKQVYFLRRSRFCNKSLSCLSLAGLSGPKLNHRCHSGRLRPCPAP